MRNTRPCILGGSKYKASAVVVQTRALYRRYQRVMSVAGAPSERSPSYWFIHACITSTGADEHAWIPLELPENSRNSSIDNQTGQAGLHSLVRNFMKVTEDETVSAPPLCSHRPTPRPPCLRRRACAAVLVPP